MAKDSNELKCGSIAGSQGGTQKEEVMRVMNRSTWLRIGMTLAVALVACIVATGQDVRQQLHAWNRLLEISHLQVGRCRGWRSPQSDC